LKEILIAIIASGAVGALLKAVWDSWRTGRLLRRKQASDLSTAEVADRADLRDQLVVAWQQMISAQQQWTQKEIEIEKRCYVAEEKLSRREEEHNRELREARRLTEAQHLQIVGLEAQIVQKDIEISALRTRLEMHEPDPHRDGITGALLE
jgi:hypothetical protein